MRVGSHRIRETGCEDERWRRITWRNGSAVPNIVLSIADCVSSLRFQSMHGSDDALDTMEGLSCVGGKDMDKRTVDFVD